MPGCGRGVWHNPDRAGRKPSRCPRHQKRDAKSETLVPLEIAGASSTRTIERRRHQRREASVLSALDFMAAARLAVGLARHPNDVQAAARLAGVMIPTPDGKLRQPTLDELEELRELAMGDEYAETRELTQQGLVGWLQVFAYRNVLTMLETEPALKNEMRPMAAHLVQQTVEKLGGKRAVYTTSSVELPKIRWPAGQAPKGET